MTRKRKNPQDWRPSLAMPKTSSSLNKAANKALKEFRSAVATLKKKGLIKGIDARKATPTKTLKKTIRENAKVLSGEEKSFKLPADMPKQVIEDLKSLGYRVKGRGKNKRIIVPSSQYVRKGSVYTKPTASRRCVKIQPITRDASFDQRVRDAFASLKIGDFIGFQVDGYNSYDVFASYPSMMEKLHEYRQAGFQYKNVVVLRVARDAADNYLADGRERRLDRKAQRRSMRAAERRAVRAGMRVSRGK